MISYTEMDGLWGQVSGTTREEMLHMRLNEFCDQMNSLGRRIEELVEKVAASEGRN